MFYLYVNKYVAYNRRQWKFFSSSNCQCSLFKKNPNIQIFCISGWLAVPVNLDKWSSTVCPCNFIACRVFSKHENILPENKRKLFQNLIHHVIGLDNVVDIATSYGLASNPEGGGEIFCTCQGRPWGPSSLQYNRHGVFPEVKQPGLGLTTHPHLVLRLKKEESYICTPLLCLLGF